MTLRPRKNIPHTNRTGRFQDEESFFSDGENIASSGLVSKQSQPTPKFTNNYFDTTKLKEEQAKDPNIRQIIQKLKSKSNTLPFVLVNDILYKFLMSSKNPNRRLQIIYLPASMIPSLLKACHDDPMTGAHFGVERTYLKIKNYYWWPAMKRSIKTYIRSCMLCQQYNNSRQKRPGQLRPISPPESPFALIGIDYCGPLKRTPRDNQYVLVITDYFTRYVTALALPDCTAETTAQALFNEYFCKFGVPICILSDQGSHFQNQLMNNIEKLIGYNHIYSTPYHPQTNGIVERFNNTFIPQISKLQDTQNNNWDEYLSAVVFAYNTGVHKTTQYSPFELVYGRLARLPISTPTTHFTFNKPNDYFEQLRKTLRIYHRTARFNIIQQQQFNKTHCDRHRSDPYYKTGDQVLTRIHGLRGKLDPKFSLTPKIIVHTQHPTYIVEDAITQNQSRVHVSDLRPISVD